MTSRTVKAVTPKSLPPKATKTVVRKKTMTVESVPSVDKEGNDSHGVRVITEMDADYVPVKHRAGRPDVVSPAMDEILDGMIGRAPFNDSGKDISVQLEAGKPFTIYQIRNWAVKKNQSGDLPAEYQRLRVANDASQSRINITLVTM